MQNKYHIAQFYYPEQTVNSILRPINAIVVLVDAVRVERIIVGTLA